jgi:hypothetical protein
VEAGREGAGYKVRVGGLVFVELFGFVKEVFIVRLAGVCGVRSISCVRKVFLVARFYVLFVSRGSGRGVDPLGTGLVFATDLFTAGRVGEVN